MEKVWNTLGLLNSMIRNGESNSRRSEKELQETRDVLERWTKKYVHPLAVGSFVADEENRKQHRRTEVLEVQTRVHHLIRHTYSDGDFESAALFEETHPTDLGVAPEDPRVGDVYGIERGTRTGTVLEVREDGYYRFQYKNEAVPREDAWTWKGCHHHSKWRLLVRGPEVSDAQQK